MKRTRLKRSFYNRPTLDVSTDLLGKLLVFHNGAEKVGGRLVEVEAYIGEDDPACHAFRGKTPRNEIMYGKAGFLYVYFTYGNHYMLNIVTEKAGFPAAVLLRGMEPVYGIERMMRNREVGKITDIASGPGKIAQALGITTDHKGLDLTGNQIYLLDDNYAVNSICQSIRIGIGNNGADRLWRFFIDGNPHVSKGSKSIRETGVPYKSESIR